MPDDPSGEPRTAAPATSGDGTSGGKTTSGPLGPALEEALRGYQRALGSLAHAEAAVEQARREASEARARLQALATGARLTDSRALVVVDGQAHTAGPEHAP